MDIEDLNKVLKLTFTLSFALFALFFSIVSFKWALCFLFFSLVNAGNIYLLSRILTQEFLKKETLKKILIFMSKVVLVYGSVVLYCIWMPINIIALIAGFHLVFIVLFVFIVLKTIKTS